MSGKSAAANESWRRKYPVHDAAELFPLLEGQAFDDLVADIAKHGLRDPIVRTVDNKILDGRNRLRACLAADVEPKFTTFRGPGKAFQYVISVNLHRRHLDTSQRAMIAAKIATLEKGRPTDKAQTCALSQDDAAELLNVSRRSVQSAKKVLEMAPQKVVDAVREGTMSVAAASEVVRKGKRGTKATATTLASSNGDAPYQLGAAMRRIGDVVRAEWAHCPKPIRPEFLIGLQQLHDVMQRDPKPIVITLGPLRQPRRSARKEMQS